MRGIAKHMAPRTWYVLINDEWRKQSSALSATIRDTTDVQARFASYPLCEGTLRAAQSGTGSVSYCPEDVPDVSATASSGPRWLSGESVRFSAIPAAGYVFQQFNVVNGESSSTVFRPEFAMTLGGDFTVEAVFSRKVCPVTFSVDQASAVSGQTVSAVVEGVPDPDFSGLVYGDRVTFSATQDVDTYRFEGWYAGGAKVSSSVTYEVALTDPLDIVAKWSAKVAASTSSTASASGLVSVGGGEFAAEASAWVVLGGSVAVAASVRAGFWNSWYDTADVEFASPLQISQEDTIVVSDTMSIVSRFVSESDRFFIALFNARADGGEADPGVVLGTVSMTQGTVIGEEEYAEGMAAAGYEGERITGAYAYYSFYGTKKSLLSAVEQSLKFSRWGSRFLSGGGMSDETLWPTERESTVYTNRHYVFTAYWGSPKPVSVGVSFCEGSRGLGQLVMSGATEARQETDESITDVATQGSEITVRAGAFSGYGFGGWHSDRSGTRLISPLPVYAYEVVADTVLYAKFVKDTNAIYRWEGSSANKTLKWKSKTYVSNKPFDPSCGRVDATEYSVGLKVEMFSSPDVGARPSGTKEVEIMSQNARRLPSGRPEKSCVLSVESDGEVDAVVIGTSMGGVAV